MTFKLLKYCYTSVLSLFKLKKFSPQTWPFFCPSIYFIFFKLRSKFKSNKIVPKDPFHENLAHTHIGSTEDLQVQLLFKTKNKTSKQTNKTNKQIKQTTNS